MTAVQGTHNTVTITRTANEALPVQFSLVKVQGTESIDLADTAGERVLGIVQEDRLITEEATVAVSGPSKIKLGGTVAQGDPLQADTDAEAILAVAGDYILAIALEAGVDQQIIECLITHEGVL